MLLGRGALAGCWYVVGGADNWRSSRGDRLEVADGNANNVSKEISQEDRKEIMVSFRSMGLIPLALTRLRWNAIIATEEVKKGSLPFCTLRLILFRFLPCSLTQTLKNLANCLEIQVSDKFTTGAEVMKSQVFRDSQNFHDPKLDLELADKDEYVFSKFGYQISEDEKVSKVESKQRNLVCFKVEFVKSIWHVKFNLESVIEGRKHALSFMRPFECLVTILNTLDHLGKFDGKADDEFFVGYSEVDQHGFFDIDTLTKSMNYESVVAGNQSNGSACTKACDNAGKARVETVPGKDYILLPLCTQDPPFSSSLKVSPDAGFKLTIRGGGGKEGMLKIQRMKNSTVNIAQHKDKLLIRIESIDIQAFLDKYQSWIRKAMKNVASAVQTTEGFEDPEFLNTIYMVEKALYALQQSPSSLGNEATKKTQKALLKQQYENFNASSSESLDSIFNRLQKLVSRLAILGVVTPPEDLNVKFLRSLPSEWDTHVVVWMNKPDFDTMGLDDLYNNFKIVEQKVKRSAGANNDDKNLAFLTTSGASSTNNINTVNPEVSTGTTKVNTTSTEISTASFSDATLYAFLSTQPQGKIIIDGRSSLMEAVLLDMLVISVFNDEYDTPSHTKKVFANMRRQGKDFSGTVTPLFATMLIQSQAVEGEGSGQPTEPQHTPTTASPSHVEPIPISSGPTTLVADETVHEERGDNVERAATTATSLNAE
ncbi:hypothetical protein Tco_1419982 [Tanacetum coccineum]